MRWGGSFLFLQLSNTFSTVFKYSFDVSYSHTEDNDMSFIHCNPNPKGRNTGDCVIRAIAICMDRSWDDVYADVCYQGLVDASMPSENSVWGNYLRKNGFRSSVIPNECPDCYTIADFATL